MKLKEKHKLIVFLFYLIGVIVLFYVINFSTVFLTQEDLVGTYNGKYVGLSRHLYEDYEIKNGIYNNGTHKLDIKSDGTYTYLYCSITGEEIEYSGTWKYCELAGDKVLVLYGFKVVPEKRDPRLANVVDMRKRGIGKLLIPLAPQNFFWFVKVK